MLRIGKFSSLSGVSIKALRYYDEIGLLRPAGLDEETGYRRYDGEQLLTARRIAALKELGFSLGEIAEIARGRDLPAVLDAKRREIVRGIGESRERLRRIDALLAQDAAPIDVVMRRTPERAGLSMRALVSNYAEADELFAESKARLPEDLRETARGALWHLCDPETRRIDCEVVYFSEAPTPRGFRRVTLPPSSSATILYAGSEWRNAYASLDRALSANSWTMTGSKLERFVLDDVTELSVPVERAR